METWRPKGVVLQLTGISESTLKRLRGAGRCKVRFYAVAGAVGRPETQVLIESLPEELQKRVWQQEAQSVPRAVASGSSLDESESSVPGAAATRSRLDHLATLLKRYPHNEREHWMDELNRLSSIVARFDAIRPKRRRNAAGKLEWVPEVYELCKQATCGDPVILKREPRRGVAPSPHTLEDWALKFQKQGSRAFLRAETQTRTLDDKRKVQLPRAAAEWINQTFRSKKTATGLAKAYEREARKRDWPVPSRTWFFRQWKTIPAILKTQMLQGDKGQSSKWASYLPRTVADLGALQIVVGDHHQCDVAVVWRDGKTLIRPWFTMWQDMRTGLIWGWHLDVTPSSYTIRMAYLNGVRQWGAQPPSLTEQGYFSYAYTDLGRDYLGRDLNGTIATYKQAARLDGAMELVRREQDIGLLKQMHVEALRAKGRNPREKPAERTFRDLADWNQENFEEWVGRDAKNKPDLYRKMWEQHQDFLKRKRQASPFMGFDEYLEAIASFVYEYNTSVHERTTLGGAKVVPVEEFKLLYTTKHTVSEGAMAMMLLKCESRMIRANGVKCSAGHTTWTWLHPQMSKFKGQYAEVYYDPNDMRTVWVCLPDDTWVEAEFVQRSSVLQPNKRAAELIKKTAANDKKVIREWEMLNLSVLRGETAEDRVAAMIEVEEEEEQQAIAVGQAGTPALPGGTVHRLTRFDRPKLAAASRTTRVTAETVKRVTEEADASGFELHESEEEITGTLVCECGDWMEEHEFSIEDGYAACTRCGCGQFHE